MPIKIISIICVFMPSGISRFLFNAFGHNIGRNVKMPFLTYINAEKIKIGNDVEFRPVTYINVKQLEIGNNTLISFGCQIKGAKGFKTGDNCFIGPHTLIHCEEDVSFGFYSGIGPRCLIYTHGSFLPVTKGFPAKFQPVVIEDYVWIAMSVTILAGSTIESCCIINPGTVVSSRVKSKSIIQNNPVIYSKMDLDKLIKFSKKSNKFYHEKILSEFLSLRGYNFSHDAESQLFMVDGKTVFSYSPDKNSITLRIGNNNIIVYDLEGYYVDFSKEKIHKSFLYFIRRRYGLVLRCNYADQASEV